MIKLYWISFRRLIWEEGVMECVSLTLDVKSERFGFDIFMVGVSRDALLSYWKNYLPFLYLDD